jgi:hypothetical protein
MFDVVWDFLPDMMHIVKGVMHGHLVPLFKGNRRPNKPKKPAAYKDPKGDLWEWVREEHGSVTIQCMEWELHPADLQKCDDRTLDLGGGERFHAHQPSNVSADWLVVVS